MWYNIDYECTDISSVYVQSLWILQTILQILSLHCGELLYQSDCISNADICVGFIRPDILFADAIKQTRIVKIVEIKLENMTVDF